MPEKDNARGSLRVTWRQEIPVLVNCQCMCSHVGGRRFLCTAVLRLEASLAGQTALQLFRYEDRTNGSRRSKRLVQLPKGGVT